MRWLFLISLFLTSAHVALGQNSDLGVLLGFSDSKSPGFGMQINYAWQVWGGPAGRLYIEAPLIVPVARQTTDIAIYLTPGLRYHFNLSSRLAIYAAAGMGLSINAATSDTGVVYEEGGGVDYRLNRRWSLRVDGRDFSEGATTIRHIATPSRWSGGNPSVMAGFGLHF
jgi:hypothetical protein